MLSRFILIFLISLILFGCTESKEPTFQDNRGQKLSLSSFKGQWLIINYWASWCKPCLTEIPQLNQLYQQRQKYNLAIIGVNYDGIRDKQLLKSIQSLDIQYPVLTQDPQSAWQLDNITVLPTTIIINPRGATEQVLIGPQTSADLLRKIRSN